jgi:hypothetical protein
MDRFHLLPTKRQVLITSFLGIVRAMKAIKKDGLFEEEE